ncbi:MAG: hypothetical protein JSR47_16685 [Proteobacteria bacterium]|nr:hypothetical protein [Pseudomonadota bacterium]MBS0548213.1 hypothetical protein [Pseudomonadota bacterium]
MRRIRRPTPADLGLNAAEGRVLTGLRTPRRIQEFIVDGLKTNFEERGDTLRSVRGVLKHRKAHCIEAAFTAACALWLAGEPPLIMDLEARGDSDHVIALFRRDGCWGAISKSNHVWLRYRDPVYRSLRELAMSYFHEYTNRSAKTLRTYSVAIDLSRFDPASWITNPEDCWEAGAALCDYQHFKLLTPKQARALAPRDPTELKADQMVQYESRIAGRARRY